MHFNKLLVLSAFALSMTALAACGGGAGSLPSTSGSESSGGTTHSTPTPTPTYSVSGTLDDYVAQTAISGAVVTIGGFPASNCIGWAACGAPVAPSYTATTGSNGTWSISNVPSGTYFMMIVSAQDANLNPATTAQAYTILHRSVVVSGANLALGTVNISQVQSYEAAWLSQLNSDRASVAYPATGAVVLDEYDEEAARAEAAAVANGTDDYGDSTESIFAQQAAAQPGYIGSGAGGVSDASTGPYDWQTVETSMFANEKANCENDYAISNGSWATCPFKSNTGHYINLAQDSLVWIGLGESANGAAPNSSGLTGGPWWIYAGVTSYDNTSARTMGVKRRAAALPPR